MIVPVEAALVKLAVSLGIDGHGTSGLVHDEKIKEEILRQLQEIGRKAGFNGIEVIVGVVIAQEEWTPVNGLVTATNKLMRKKLEEKHKTEIEEVYKSRK